MPATIKTDSPRTHTGDSSFVSIVSGWAQQGVQTFFATQRILLDLAMRQCQRYACSAATTDRSASLSHRHSQRGGRGGHD